MIASEGDKDDKINADKLAISDKILLFIHFLSEVLSRFQDAFTFTVAVDIDLLVRTLWHLDTFERIVIKLITRYSGIKINSIKWRRLTPMASSCANRVARSFA